jgi:hypothetical protein
MPHLWKWHKQTFAELTKILELAALKYIAASTEISEKMTARL